MATADEDRARSSEAPAGGSAPGAQGMSISGSLAAVSQVADPKRLLWLGGLAAVGALGVLEWPVVAAVGVGTYVAEQLAKADPQRQRSQNGPHPGRPAQG